MLTMAAHDPAAFRRELIEAQQLLKSGSLDAADAILSRLLIHAPNDADALYLGGVLANRRKDYGNAIALLERAVSLTQKPAPGWLALGNAYAGCDQPVLATNAYREVLAREPESFEAHYNLGLMQKRQGSLLTAAHAFHSAWVLNANDRDAASHCVESLAAWARAAQEAETSVPLEPPPRRTMGTAKLPTFTIAVCSVDDAKLDRVRALYRRLFAGIDHEILTIRNARSLAEAYNWAVEHSTHDMVVLSHDDIDILAPDFAARLAGHLARFDAMGVVGGLRMTGPQPLWSGHPHLRGWITHHPQGDPVWQADVLSPMPVCGDAVVLDGVLLAGWRTAFAAVPFDAETFDGFHLYDVDWSYRAGQQGMRLGIAGDLLLAHESRGRYDQEWARYAARFCDKHGLAATSPPTEGPFYEAAFDSAGQVRAFFERLTEFADDLPIS
jgi:tetratricopeptide (TPR) repeat protein